MSSATSALDRTIEVVLMGGLAVSAALLVAGLAVDRVVLLRWGILVLMATPVARVVVVTIGMLRERDWLFAAISLWILSVLGSSIYWAMGR
jgi:uncharacterized membrane protein